MRNPRRRLAVALAATAAGIPPRAVAANAAVVTPTTPRAGSLVQVGPIADNGFPTWYRDSNGIRLELCYTLDDPNCTTVPDEVPNPAPPISFPDNFPAEAFYQLASADLTTGAAGSVQVDMNLEGAFGAG